MMIIGERINSTRKHIREGIKARNAAFIIKEARTQLEAGAKYVDINCAVTETDEVQDLDWVLSVIQSDIPDVSLCIDSPNVLAIERALKVYKSRGSIIINSITGEESRINKIVPLAIQYNTKLIALAMNEKGMPETAQDRYSIAAHIVDRVKSLGFNEANLYIDPLIRPISTEPVQAKEFLKSLPLLKKLGSAKTICGLSNVSFGLPNRGLINASFMTMAIQNGLDAAIIDPTDKRVMSSVFASNALVANDEYCADFIRAFREGRLI